MEREPGDIFHMIHVVPMNGKYVLSAAPLQGPGGAIPYSTLSAEELTGALQSIGNPPKDLEGLMRDITGGMAVSVLAFLNEDDLRMLHLVD
jgi:hypothetical protein